MTLIMSSITLYQARGKNKRRKRIKEGSLDLLCVERMYCWLNAVSYLAVTFAHNVEKERIHVIVEVLVI